MDEVVVKVVFMLGKEDTVWVRVRVKVITCLLKLTLSCLLFFFSNLLYSPPSLFSTLSSPFQNRIQQSPTLPLISILSFHFFLFFFLLLFPLLPLLFSFFLYLLPCFFFSPFISDFIFSFNNLYLSHHLYACKSYSA